MAALLNLARDKLRGGGSAAYKEKSGFDQRGLDGHLGGGYFIYCTLTQEKPGKEDKSMLRPSTINMRPSDPKIPKKDYRRKKTETAKETSHMAKTQQLAGSTNKL